MRRAFTLIELLFVMAIMGILFSIAISGLTSIFDTRVPSAILKDDILSSKNLIENKIMKASTASDFLDDLDSRGYKNFDKYKQYKITVGNRTYTFVSDLLRTKIYLKSGCCKYEYGRCVDLGYNMILKNDTYRKKYRFYSCVDAEPHEVEY